jgi:hypothetical protein
VKENFGVTISTKRKNKEAIMDELFGFVLLPLGGLCLWVLFSAAVADAAKKKGRSKAAYFWLSFFFSPILAGIVLGLHGPLTIRGANGETLAVTPAQGSGPTAITGMAQLRPATPGKTYTPADYRRDGRS